MDTPYFRQFGEWFQALNTKDPQDLIETFALVGDAERRAVYIKGGKIEQVALYAPGVKREVQDLWDPRPRPGCHKLF
ncbi:hypothetical protein SAMD00023353_5100990 [Rosellinia necatrix]|uniref:Uncharacterized protein n=1 Tax=Rosellinia necatrix TaxID=77044 RepID=A0A1S8A9N1_ROSNE|nr:hypothetical protein SAMD00023353_5100990 [Rosellinia necatrix]